MYTTSAALNTNISRAIRNHLMDLDLLPPTTALSELASEITDVVFVELEKAGLSKKAIDTLNLNVALKKSASAGSAA